MGLATTLGYAQSGQGPLRRLIISWASAPLVSKVSSKVLTPIDKVALRVTGGRSTMTSLITGLPVLWLTTVGARSGQLRTVPLLAFPVGQGIALIGTRFGQESTPGWVHNLEASEQAVVSYRDTEVPVRARAADDNEVTEVWAKAAAVYPGYAVYTKRASHRQIRVFVLEAKH